MNKKILKSLVILASSFILAIVLVKPIGVSTEYSITAGIIQDTFVPSTVEKKGDKVKTDNAYYAKKDGEIAKNIEKPLSYGMLFVFSIPFGALVSAGIQKLRRKESDASTIQLVEHEKSHPFVLILGGALLLFGARWAGGCTSGHMMSGIMQSSVSGLVFAMVVFASAITTALIVKHFKGGK